MENSISLTRLEALTLRFLYSGGYSTLKGLAVDLGRSLPRVSETVKGLEQKGFLVSERKGTSKRASFSQAAHASLFRRYLGEHPQMPVESLLSDSSLEVLLPLCTQRLSAKEAAKQSGCSIQTVGRALRRLRGFGIVLKQGKLYDMSRSHKTLCAFVLAYQGSRNLQMVSSCTEAVIIWEGGKEFLFRTKSKVSRKHFFSTCFDAAADFAVPLLTTEYKHYFYSPFRRKRRVEDVILHILLEGPYNARNTLYALLLLAKNKVSWDYLKKEAELYSITEKAEGLEVYCRSKGAAPGEGYPSWAEFQDKLGEYK